MRAGGKWRPKLSGVTPWVLRAFQEEQDEVQNGSAKAPERERALA